MTKVNLFCSATTHGSEKCVSLYKYNFESFLHIIVNMKKLSFYRMMLIYLILVQNYHKSVFWAADCQE